MDITTILGLIASIVLLVGMAGSELAGLYEGMTLLFVAVGGFAASMVSLPLYRIASLPGVMKNVFFWTNTAPTELLERIVGFAETARREGILALERALDPKDDAFLSQGTRLAVDGTEPDLIMDILETELKFIEERHEAAQEAMGVLARNWGLFGALGAIIVLVQQAGTAASGMILLERALLPLLYAGLLVALIGLPFARKLKENNAREALTKRMIIEGIMSIQQGDNPRIVEHKLAVFLAPRLRPRADEEKPPAPADAAEAQKPEDALSSLGGQDGESSPSEGEEEAPASPPPEQTARPAPSGPPPRRGEEEAKLEIEQVDLMLRLVRETLERHAVDAERMALIDQMIGRVVEEKLVMFSLFSLLGEEIREEVLVVLQEEAPQLVDQVRSQGGWFDFDDLDQLNDREIQSLLREVDETDLAIALKGAGQAVQDKMLGNMSARVRDFVNKEMQGMGEIADSEIREVQGRIIQKTIQLQLQGQISGLGTGVSDRAD